MIGRLLLEWRTKQTLEYEKKNRQYTNEEMFQDDQMMYLLAPHLSGLQTDTTKFKQDFIGQIFMDTAIDKTHMLLQNLHHRYLYIVIRLPHLKDLDQKIPSFPNCDNYGICRASNPNP